MAATMIATITKSMEDVLGQAKTIKAYLAGCFMLTMLALATSLGGLQTAHSYLRPSAAPAVVLESKTLELDVATAVTTTFDTKSLAAPMCSTITPEEVDFTLVTQLSVNRLWLMEQHCQRWSGHRMSLVVGGPLSRDAVLRALQSMGCPTEESLLQLSVVPVPSDASYPVNALRNLALSQIRTSHAVFLDADFVPSEGLYEHLHQYHRPILAASPKTALVLPAFELRPFCNDASCHDLYRSVLPRRKAELIDMMTLPLTPETTKTDLVAQFDSKGNPAGHGSTDYARWIQSQADEELVKIECLTSPRYEPYVVIRYCQDMPPFQTAFNGYGMNKLSWTQHLRHVGYQFYQVGQDFVVHFPHAKSAAWKKWNQQRQGSLRMPTDMDRVGVQFRAWLAESVPSTPVMPYCDEELISISATSVVASTTQ